MGGKPWVRWTRMFNLHGAWSQEGLDSSSGAFSTLPGSRLYSKGCSVALRPAHSHLPRAASLLQVREGFRRPEETRRKVLACENQHLASLGLGPGHVMSHSLFPRVGVGADVTCNHFPSVSHPGWSLYLSKGPPKETPAHGFGLLGASGEEGVCAPLSSSLTAPLLKL